MIDFLSPESPLSISAEWQAVTFGHLKPFIFENKTLQNNNLIENIYSTDIDGVFIRESIACLVSSFSSMECLHSTSAR